MSGDSKPEERLYIKDYILDRMINNKNLCMPIGIVINTLPLPLEIKQIIVNYLMTTIDIYNNSNEEFWFILGIENSSIKYHIKKSYAIIANSFGISNSLSKQFHILLGKLAILSNILLKVNSPCENNKLAATIIFENTLSSIETPSAN